ncbi:CubicO group peptidase (beta-lactamase class C family) [Bradyrhizobium diazoefficiens]|uniref:Serine hydrolase n=1 Tax=Bradyrhizobium diazoefficiens TaxID=1355477 RepID=A0A810CX23_9BRAD|nr:serine hydrolase domain-containing protein [Bradyrhizobium diazoefficiens]WLA77274.1 serine hydrolase domain-containing protein [Bradyrhizobium diazoefficiens]BCE23341.1 serine hydrolase [Bradyrhizobium diazoefficiens]BCE49604.1 serine hydrolase [Bradyrhizobium diazoefficiens]BCE93115.1 serine hydrolase [Bradyrhizobium diazoefficiens]BCF28046.1 serine hydrolase [Bradyrhizobium diazoefficiens]
MKRREFLVGAALLAGTMARSRAADIPAPAPEGLDRITAFFDSEVTSGRLPGAVIMVQQHGKPVYLKTFGVRDVRTGLAMTPDTIFAIHSMTKPITCLGAMMLIDEGKLALTDPASKYVPLFAGTKVGLEVTEPDGKLELDLVPPVRPVNIEDLLRHTSGISYDYIGGKWVEQAYKAANIFEDPFNNRKFADRIAKLPLARQPGTLWRYGHSTDVLGAIIEIISGQTLYDFLKQRILDPLGMSSTKFALATEDELARMARPLPNDYILLAAERDRLDHPEWQSGGGGLLSTITDYQRFSQMLLNRGEFEGRRYLSPAAFKAMTTDHVGPGSGVGRDYFYFPGDGFGYGYGLAVRTDPGNAKPPPPGSIGELKWDSGSGTYFGVDPKLDMVYLMMQQTQNERSRITPAFKALVYDCFPPALRRP